MPSRFQYSISSDEALRVRIGERTAQARVHFGKTLQDVADAIGVSRQFIWQVCDGKRTLAVHKLCLLAKFFGLSVEWFVVDSPKPLKKRKAKQVPVPSERHKGF